MEISYCYTVLRAAFIYCFKNIYHPRKKNKENREREKNIKYAKGRKPITSLTYGSPLDNELSLLFGSVCHASPKNGKKKVPIKKKIIIIITVIILNNTN